MENELKTGDFFIQKTETGNMLRRVLTNEDFSIDNMFSTFDKHVYYPISLSTAKLFTPDYYQKVEL